MPHLGVCFIPRDSGVRDPDQHLDPNCGWRLFLCHGLLQALGSKIFGLWNRVEFAVYCPHPFQGSPIHRQQKVVLDQQTQNRVRTLENEAIPALFVEGSPG